MKKIIFAVTSIVVLASCSSQPVNSLFSDTSDNISALSSKSKKRLPDLPSNPVFAVFNNAYKPLAADNNQIGHADPNNSDKYLFKVISSAVNTLDVAFFDIDDPDATQAIIDAKNRGVTVRVVTDTDNLKDKQDPTLPRKAIEDLKAAGIEVKDDKRQPFMHDKFMIVDNKSVWAGSMNPTTTSMYEHNNNCVFIQSPELAQNYALRFNDMFNGNFGSFTGQIPNPVVNVGDATIKTYFSPRGGTKQAIVDELKKASKSIKFMAFSYTDKDVGALMVSKKNQGLSVEGVYDTCLIDKYSTYYTLRGAKIPVYKDGNQALLHHKTIIIDDETVITGSFNFSNSAENSNDEDTLIIKSESLADMYNKEYARIKYAALNNTNIPPYDHPACNHRAVVSNEE